MKKLIEYLENDSHADAYEYLLKNPVLLKEKTEDGWSLIQLGAYFNHKEILNYCFKNLNKEEIEKNKVHPLELAIEEKNIESINVFLNNPDKIEWNRKTKSGENFIHLLAFYDLYDLIPDFIKKGVSPIEKNNQAINAMHLLIEKGKEDLFDYCYENIEFSEFYDETLIKKSIKSDNPLIFERLLPYTNLEADELFNLATGFNSIKVLASLMSDGKIIPGMEQITSIVDLMCKKYESIEEQKSAKELANYLFEINIPFNKFINKNGQSAWMLCIENDNEEIFERLMNSSENVNINDNEQHTPLLYAIEKMIPW